MHAVGSPQVWPPARARRDSANLSPPAFKTRIRTVHLGDTIAAISSGVGPAARMIVRASGPQSAAILDRLCPSRPSPATRTPLHLDGLRVPVWVYCFAQGHSYTGDDLFEIHLPGNPLLARILLDIIYSLGARAAEPGEFTARAFFNGRIGLSEAEGVAAVIAAGNQAELDAGRRLMAGELARRLRPVMDQLAQTLALVEAEIDFSDQDVKFLAAGEVADRLVRADRELDALLKGGARFSRLSHEPRVVLAGRPNAGKSTLLNALSQSARAIVSPMAGTTRDALSAPVVLDRGIIQLVDIAGLHQSATEIETKMRERAMKELEKADAVVLLHDVTDTRPSLELVRTPDLTVISKVDLVPQSSVLSPQSCISAVSGFGLDRLRHELDALAFGAEGGAELALSARHIQAITDSREALARAAGAPAELMAAGLRQALDFLGQVLGDITPDDILGRIFSTFCIGK
jgi:tRNA modification GTPase